MKRILSVGSYFLISGKVKYSSYTHQYEIHVEDYDKVTGLKSVEVIVPFYQLTEGVYQKKLRGLVKFVLDNYLDKLIDSIPSDIRKEHSLMELKAALRELHFPSDRGRWRQAHHRLVFDDFFYIELGMAVRYWRVQHGVVGISFPIL